MMVIPFRSITTLGLVGQAIGIRFGLLWIGETEKSISSLKKNIYVMTNSIIG